VKQGAVGGGQLVLIAPTVSERDVVALALGPFLARGEVEIVLSGMGPARAVAVAERLGEGSLPGGLALLGWAGGILPELEAGDVVLAEAAVDSEGRRIDLSGLGWVRDLPGAHRGALLTTEEVLLSAREKRAARSSGALAVEMEAYPLAAWATAHGVPFVHARVVLDPAGEKVPDLGEALDACGRIRAGRLVRRLAARPSLVRDLAAMAGRVRRLRPILGALALDVVEAWSLPAPA
jgi:nucleoside phosphorylase